MSGLNYVEAVLATALAECDLLFAVAAHDERATYLIGAIRKEGMTVVRSARAQAHDPVAELEHRVATLGAHLGGARSAVIQGKIHRDRLKENNALLRAELLLCKRKLRRRAKP